MPDAKDARRLQADPENEPDFYTISRLYPLERLQIPRRNLAHSMASPPTLPVVMPPRLHTRLASNVDWLADGGPAFKRINQGIPAHYTSASGAISHAFLTGRMPNLTHSQAPHSLPLPQHIGPTNDHLHPDFLLTALLQQISSNPPLVRPGFSPAMGPILQPPQQQQQSYPASMADWFRQQQRDFR